MTWFTLAHAVDYVLPTLPGQPTPPPGPAGWVSNLYQFSLMGAGLLAFGVIVYAGFMYALKAGNPSAQSDARDRILQALLGLLLLLGAYVILSTINPQLVSLPTKFGFTELEGPQNGQTNTSNNPSTVYKCQTGVSGEGCYTDSATCSRRCGNGGTSCTSAPGPC